MYTVVDERRICFEWLHSVCYVQASFGLLHNFNLYECCTVLYSYLGSLHYNFATHHLTLQIVDYPMAIDGKVLSSEHTSRWFVDFFSTLHWWHNGGTRSEGFSRSQAQEMCTHWSLWRQIRLNTWMKSCRSQWRLALHALISGSLLSRKKSLQAMNVRALIS